MPLLIYKVLKQPLLHRIKVLMMARKSKGGVLKSVLFKISEQKAARTEYILMCENRNNPEMSSLPRTKYKEKWLQWQSQTKNIAAKHANDVLLVSTL